MDLSALKFWKKGKGSSRRIIRRSSYLGGYYGASMPVRVPQVTVVDMVWLGLLLLASNAFMMISLFKFYLNFDDYSHAILVPVIAGAAAWRVLSLAEEKPVVIGDWKGLPVLALGLSIQFVAMWYEIGLVAGGIVSEYFTSVGLVISIWGIFISFFGIPALKLFWFPLGYLIFMIPGLPGPPEVWLKAELKDIVTNTSTFFLELFGYSVFVQENVIEFAASDPERNPIVLGIADACSGIRSLWAMLAVAPAAAWFLRLRPFLIALFLPLGVFLAIFQNVIRVIATALFCDWFGMTWAMGRKHDMVGGVSFFLSAITLVVVARILAPPLQKKVESVGAYSSYGVYGSYGMSSGYGYGGGSSSAAYHADTDPEAQEEQKLEIPAEVQREWFYSRISRVRIAVYGLLVLMLIAQLALYQRYAIRNRVQYEIAQRRLSLDVFPGQIGEYKRIYWGELPEIALRILKPSESYVGWYASPDNRLINVIINFWEPVIGFNGSTWAFPHSPDVCFREAGWAVEEKVTVPEWLTDENEILYSRMYKNDQERQMVLYWYNRDEVTRIMNAFIHQDRLHEEDPQYGVDMRALGALFTVSDSSYLNRIRHMFRSWGRPKEYSRYQYSVGIYVPVQGEPEESVQLAHDFARQLRPTLAPFGLKPLQELDLDNLEESLQLPEVDTLAATP